MGFTLMQQGTFTSDGDSRNIYLQSNPDYFRVVNLTQSATTQSTGRGIEFEWYRGLTADDNAIKLGKENSSNIVNKDLVTSGGFTFVEEFPLPGAAISVTGITAANPAVVSATQSYSDGDIVRLYGTTGMLQISGMLFDIDNASGSDFELPGLDASGFAAAATAGTVRKIEKAYAFTPSFYYVTKITKASSAVVTTSMTHNFEVGQAVTFSVPSSFGMSEIDQLTGVISAVTTHTFTVDINSTGFSTFAFPASSLSPAAALFATVAPAGSRNISNPVNPFKGDLELPYMHLASGAQSPAGSSSDVIVWQSFRKDN